MTTSPKPLSQVVADNSTAQSALAKRLQSLDNAIRSVDDKLSTDRGLAAYPDAVQRLERVKSAAQDGKSVIAQEQAVRERLGAAAQSGDQAGVKQAQADLTALKKNNPKIFGKESTSSPKVECPALSSTTCDTAISNVHYLGTTGPSSPLSAKDPCYGTSLAEWDGWDDMIAHGCATAEERDIITAMSANEGSAISSPALTRPRTNLSPSPTRPILLAISLPRGRGKPCFWTRRSTKDCRREAFNER